MDCKVVVNSFIHNGEKCQTFFKILKVLTLFKILDYVKQFFNFAHERVKSVSFSL